jgi:hypothetical protein
LFFILHVHEQFVEKTTSEIPSIEPSIKHIKTHSSDTMQYNHQGKRYICPKNHTPFQSTLPTTALSAPNTYRLFPAQVIKHPNTYSHPKNAYTRDSLIMCHGSSKTIQLNNVSNQRKGRRTGAM